MIEGQETDVSSIIALGIQWVTLIQKIAEWRSVV